MRPGPRTSPNPLGGDGLPAIGETAAAQRIADQVPDLTDPVVAGSGHSALTALVASAGLAEGNAKHVHPSRDIHQEECHD